jgi:hypothetical protein
MHLLCELCAFRAALHGEGVLRVVPVKVGVDPAVDHAASRDLCGLASRDRHGVGLHKIRAALRHLEGGRVDRAFPVFVSSAVAHGTDCVTVSDWPIDS